MKSFDFEKGDRHAHSLGTLVYLMATDLIKLTQSLLRVYTLTDAINAS